MESKFVSVIIPAYNAELYIVRAIESVLAQTYRDLEIIVVDDGSADNTASIARQFEDSIHYVYQSNRGLAAARNTGIRHAHSDIIALLDADDLWEPEFLEVMTGLLEQNPQAAGVYCGFQYIDSQGNIVGKPNLTVVPPEGFHNIQLIQGNWLSACGVLFHKHLAEEVGLFDESLRALEDADLWIRLSADRPFVGLPRALVKYRRHDSNMSKDPQHMIKAKSRVMEKAFGPAEGDVSSWSNQKVVAYLNHFRSAAVRYLAAGYFEKSADQLCQMAVISLDYLCSLDVWRGLARAHVPDEFQFDSSFELNWKRMQEDITGLLKEVKQGKSCSRQIQDQFSRLKGFAFLALADEAVRARKFGRTLRWIFSATIAFPQLWLARPFWGTIARAFLRNPDSWNGVVKGNHKYKTIG